MTDIWRARHTVPNILKEPNGTHGLGSERGQITFFILLVLVCVSVGAIITTSGIPQAVGLVGALIIFSLAFASTEAALYLLIFSMLLSPEISMGTTSQATLDRGVTLRLDDFMLVIIGFSWFVRSSIHKELGLFIRTPINKPIFAYILVTLVATALGVMVGRIEMKTGFLFVLKYFEYFVIYFMVANHLRSEKQVRNFLIALFITAGVVSALAIWQIPGGSRVTAPFEGETGEPNTLGGYLLLIMGLVMAFLFTRGAVSSRIKIILLILLSMMFTAFMFTLSRGSWVAFIPTFLVLVFLSDMNKIIALAIIPLLILAAIFVPDVIRKRVEYTFSQHRSSVHVGAVTLDTSTSARLRSWGEALKDTAKKPILGYGVTGYKFLDAQYFRVLVETGIVGILAFLWLLMSILRIGWQGYKQESQPFRKALYLGLIVGLTGMMAHAIGANTFIIVRIMGPFWFFTGLVLSLPRLDKSLPGIADLGSGAERFPQNDH